jgi:hypothetical protein
MAAGTGSRITGSNAGTSLSRRVPMKAASRPRAPGSTASNSSTALRKSESSSPSA